MTASTRETQLIETIVLLADTLVAGFDVVDLLQTLVERCGELVDSSGAGIQLTGASERLEMVASTDDTPAALEALELAGEAGPALDCVRAGQSLSLADIAADDTWPRFREAALATGFLSVHVVPLRLRETTIGAMTLFRDVTGAFDDADVMAAQALADVATIGILQERAIREADVARAQLQRALDSRVLIEQAKGVVAYKNGIDMAAAFDRIRSHARAHRLGISEVAEQIVQRRLAI